MVEPLGAFHHLDPVGFVPILESTFGLTLDGTVEPFNSYVNRVFGLSDAEGGRWVVKFYRPGRWTLDAIDQEHDLLFAALDADIPVVAPHPDAEGYCLHRIELGGSAVPFALFPRRAGRTFDTDTEAAFLRIGAAVGRLHRAIRDVPLGERCVGTPEGSTVPFLERLRHERVVHPEIEGEFFDLAFHMVEAAAATYRAVAPPLIPLHGDLHRGNILERPEGLLLIDFDDAMTGPAVQDLWMLTGGRIADAGQEWELLAEGYRQFLPFDHNQLRLIEPLRFMRMIYYLAWQALQRADSQFREHNPDWGTRAFWIRELEDLRDQARAMQAASGD